MENFKITEKLSDGTQQELCISDVIGRLLQKTELLYGKTDDIEYKIEQYDDSVWIVQHNYIPYERDDVVKMCLINDL
jgi:hypothetical protein